MKREIESVDFGEWMKEKRKNLYLNQEVLADIVDCHASSIGRWERGEDYPKLDVVERIVKALGAEIVIREMWHEERTDEGTD